MENLETTKRTAIEIEEKVSGMGAVRCQAAGGRVLLRHVAGCWRTPTLMCVKVKEAKVTEAQINVARENYRPAAERASLLYFILSDLNKINPIYQFSLKVTGGSWFVWAGRGLGTAEICC